MNERWSSTHAIGTRTTDLLPLQSCLDLRTGGPDLPKHDGVIWGCGLGYPLAYEVEPQEVDGPRN